MKRHHLSRNVTKGTKRNSGRLVVQQKRAAVCVRDLEMFIKKRILWAGCGVAETADVKSQVFSQADCLSCPQFQLGSSRLIEL